MRSVVSALRARRGFRGSRRQDAAEVLHKCGACVGQQGAQQLWTSAPLEMGRRACKIADRKAAQSLKRNKVNCKLGKEIAKAAREGGPNTASNLALAALIQRAKELNVSKEVIERNIKKAKDKEQQDFIEVTYEAYGFGGVGLVVEVLTDNQNRASSFVRDVVKRSKAKMANSGSVLFNFKRAGVVAVKASGVNAEDLLIAATEAGAEDVLEPEASEDDPSDDKYFKVITAAEDFGRVNSGLKEASFLIDTDNSGLELIPNELVEADDEAMELNKVLIDKLLELEDVDAVYSNQKP